MGIFCITRHHFLDRPLDMHELLSLSDFLRALYRIRSASRTGETGSARCDSRLYAFPRQLGPALQQSLMAKLPDVEIDCSNPDELRLTGHSHPVEGPADVRVWLETLGEPLMQNRCIQLRFTIEGWTRFEMNAFSTFVLCGEPTPDGKLLLKAVWPLSYDEHEALIFRSTKWPDEATLLDAWQIFRSQAGTQDTAQLAYNAFQPKLKQLFMTRRQDRSVMTITRFIAELPDDRGPAAFIRRVSIPLLIGVALLVLAATKGTGAREWWLPLILAVVFFLVSLRIVFKKLLHVRAYHDRMREGLGKLYAGQVKHELVDLCADTTSTLTKLSADIEAWGGVHVCDVGITTETVKADANRIYRLGDTLASFGLLRKYGTLLFFPPKPVILMNTQFKNGRRHFTKNRPQYRKNLDKPEYSIKCMIEEHAGFDEVYALHRQYVDQFIAEGLRPLNPLLTGQQVLIQMREDYELGKVAWQKSPYSWSDAIHESFKMCRREFLPD